MTLREMTVEDIDQVHAIEVDRMHPPWSKEGFLTFLMRKETLFFVVEEKGEILAYAGMMYVLDEGDITNVVVRRDREGEGIGGFMLDGLLRIALEFGITTVHLDVRRGNAPARRLYQRAGFLEDGVRAGYYTEPVEDAILMTRVDPSVRVD